MVVNVDMVGDEVVLEDVVGNVAMVTVSSFCEPPCLGPIHSKRKGWLGDRQLLMSTSI